MKLIRNSSFFLQTAPLLLPGFLNAVFSLLLSSHRLFPTNQINTNFLLNVAQLLSFGVTIAKYAADQMILTRLNRLEKTEVTTFFRKRVFPLSIAYCLLISTGHDWETVFTLLICLPIEVWIIMVCTELNVSGKHIHSMVLNLLGYPLCFFVFVLSAFANHINTTNVLFIFGCVSAIKLTISFFIRNRGLKRNDVLIFSGFVPLQQSGNYLLFKADQMLIAITAVPSAIFLSRYLKTTCFIVSFLKSFLGLLQHLVQSLFV